MATQFATLHEIRMRTADARHALLIRFARTTRVFGIQTLRARNQYGPVVRRQWLWLLIAATGTTGIILLLLFQIFGGRHGVKELAASEASSTVSAGAATVDALLEPVDELPLKSEPPGEEFSAATDRLGRVEREGRLLHLLAVALRTAGDEYRLDVGGVCGNFRGAG